MSTVSKTLSALREFSKRQLTEQLERSRETKRRKARRRLRAELCEERVLLASDLLPFAFTGWDDAIVISSNPGDRTDDPITVADTVYFDFGWANLGDASTGGTYAVEAKLDGVPIVFNGAIPDTASFSGFSFSDVTAGPLTAGVHTIEFSVDVNFQIAENDETNNTRTRQFTVTAVGTEDFGDAPTAAQSGLAASYPTTLADNGARHTPLAGFQLGALVDVEPDGQPSVGAIEDDSINADDEDGVEFVGAATVGGTVTVDVTVTNTAGVANPYLDAWIDFNQDGDWDDAGEQIFSGAVSAGVTSINVNIPGTTSTGVTYSRFRLHDGTTGLAVTGLASDGEVEDHLLQISTAGQWVDQGPAPTINGQLEPNTQPDRRVTGAIHTVVAHPTDADTVYIGGVNGGIWKTTNFTATNPDWTPQTDFLESLAIGALAFDPTDATFNTLVAGTAKYSSFAGFGGIRGPVYRTVDGGNTWLQLGSNGLRTVGENISGISGRGNTIVVSSSGNFGGIFRSTDTGANFSPITDSDFVSPNNDFSDLVEDPSDVTDQRLYAVSPGVGGSGGIYRSDDFGVNWTKITGPGINTALDDLLQDSNNVEMAVHPTTGRLFVATLVSGQPRGVFYSSNSTSATPTWTQMDVPVLPLGGTAPITGATNATPIVITSAGHGLFTGNFVVIDGVTGNTAANGFYRITRIDANTFSLDDSAGNGAYAGGGTWSEVTGPNPRPKDIDETGAQGRIHFSIVVDPTNEDIVYIGGDRQDQPNVIGDNTFGGAIFRGDASIPRNPNVAPSPQWDHATHDVVPGVDPDGGTANGTATHADSREMTFGADGNLIEVDDGGIYMRTSPRDNTGDWFSKAGTLGVVEFHDVAYDSNSDIIMGGTQDNGTHFQQTPGGKVWDFLSGGDGGDVVVDNITLAGVNQSIRYSSSQNLGGFRRTTWDASNNLVNTVFPARTVISGSAFAPQFKTPLQLNAIDPTRMLLLGANGIYESLTQGDTISQLNSASPGFLQDAVDYGGFQGGVPNEDVFYVGYRDDVHIRTSSGGAITVSDPDPGTQDINDVVMNTEDWANAFAVDDNQVFQTLNSGTAWNDITGNLMSIAGEALQTVAFVPGSVGALVVGANQGVFVSKMDSLGTWSEVGTNLPNALVFDLIYNSTDDVLLAGTLGRGAWTFANASTLLAGNGAAQPDFGDAPSAAQSGFASTYPVTLADDGARHDAGVGPQLGLEIDYEADGTNSAAADADDTTGTPDDEDGVIFAGPIVASSLGAQTGSVDVELRNADLNSNRLDAWVDFNRDGDWDDAGEQIFNDFDLGTTDGIQTLNFTIPLDTGTNVVNGDTFARFRVSTVGGLGVTGSATDGEVEDHLVSVVTADPYVVDTLLDEDDGDFSANDFSLREAIGLANASAARPDEIVFAPGLAGGTITLTIDQLTITDDLIITGLGATNLTVSGDDTFRVFDVQGADVVFDGLTITAGRTTATVIPGVGAGIRSDGTVELRSSILTNNHTTGAGADGGGIHQRGGGLLIIEDSIVSDNSVIGFDTFGGGIRANDSDVIISRSTISGNTTNSAGQGLAGGLLVVSGNLLLEDSTVSNNANLGAASSGGGVVVASGNMDIIGSTIVGNSTTERGGGILWGATAHVANVVNSTISGNTATSNRGGGIAVFQGTFNLRHSTVTGNSAPAGLGSGLSSHSDGTAVSNTNILSSIISGNVNSDVDNVLSGTGTNTITSNNFNLIGTGNALASFNQANDQTNVTDPGLAPLANNGGLTDTHALLVGSPAIDAGDTTSAETFDQRGVGFPRLVGPRVDVGAFESEEFTIVSVAVSPDSVLEDGATDLVYTFTRTGDTSGALTVNFDTTGTATSGTDYTSTATGTVTFGAGSSTATVTVDPTADPTVEPDETVILTVTAGTGYFVGTPDSATGTITNDDISAVSVTATNDLLGEDAAGTLTYEFARDNFSLESPALTVNFSTTGTATLGTDYTASHTGTITFGAGQRTAILTADPTPDSIVEPNETVIITVTPGAGYNVDTTPPATGTIINDDRSTVTIAVDPDSILEDAAGVMTYTITRDNVSAETPAATIDFNTTGTATAGVDYTASATGSVSFAAGATTAVVTVDPTADTDVEPDETVILTLDVGADFIPGSPITATGTILNDDAVTTVSVAVAPTSVQEDGATDLVYTFTRTGSTAGPLTVNFDTIGTATSGVDYTASDTGTVTFGAGSATAVVTIDPTADTIVEPDETVVLNVAAGAGYSIGAPASAIGTITNDDVSDVSVAVDPASILEDAAGVLTYTFTRSNASAETPALTINFDTTGTATSGTDYTQSATGTVSFAAGADTATVTVDPTADTTVEPDETVVLTVAAGTGYGIGAPASAIGTITNDDVSDVSVAVDPDSILEDAAGVMTYTFTRDNTSAETPGLTVNFDTTGSATSGTDYTQSATGTVSFAAGADTATVTVDPTVDTTVEPDETVILTVAAGAGYNVGAPASATGTILNDDVSSVSVAVDPDSILEDAAGVMTYTFTRDNTSAQTPALTVNFDTTGSATSGTDYTQSATGTVSFAAGADTATVTVDPTADTTVEPDETVILTVAAGTGYNVGAPASATGTILNDDVSSVSVAVDPDSILEDAAGVMTYTFTRDNTSAQTPALTVNFDTTGSATSGTDYTQSATGTVSFAAGADTATVTVDPTVDTTVEPDETVILTVAAGAGYNVGAPASATGTILNDDVSSVSVAVDPDSILEDAAGVMTYTFTRDNTSAQTPALTINFDTTGSATSGTDYTQSATGTVSFAAGSDTATVTVDPTADTTVEPDETVILTVAAGAGYNVGAPASATGTILNDDVSSVSVAVDPDSILEDAAGVLTYTFTRDNTSAQTPALTINFDTTGSATSGTDYTQNATGTVSFAAGADTATVTVDPTADTIVEPDETVILTVAAGAGYNVGAPASATGTITNDDVNSVSVTVDPDAILEDGVGVMTYTFTRDNTSAETPGLTINFDTTGTATSGTDYTQSATGTVSFAAGSDTATVTVDPTADATVEPDETVILTVAAGAGYNVGVPASATGTILNDDAVSLVSVAVAPTSVLEGGATDLIYTFTRTGDISGALTVNFDTTGSATSGTDYSASDTGTVAFAAGSGTATVTVDPIDDAIVEPDETVILTVLAGSGYGIGAPSSATGTITDDDISNVTVAVDPDSILEDAAGVLTYTFTRDNTSAETPGLTINFGTTGTATAGTDYAVSATGTVAFAPGSSTAAVTIDPTADAIVELDETVILSVAGGSGYAVGEPNSATGVITNDDAATLSIDDVVQNEGDTGAPSGFFFTVTLDNDVDTGFTVDYATVDGTATTADNDYQAVGGTLPFDGNAAETETIFVPVTGDTKVELNENFFVDLFNVQAGGRAVNIATPFGTGTIVNDDSATLSIDDVTLSEGDAGTTAFTFTITLNAEVDNAVAVDFTTANGTATTGDNDYVASNGTANFVGNAGETQTVTIDVNGDTTVEPDETFFVDLANIVAGGRNVTFADNQGLGTILNDDVAATPEVESIVYFNENAAAEQSFSPDSTGQRSIIRRVEVVFSGPVNVPVGPVTDDSFIVESTSVSPGTQVGLEVLSSTLVGGKQVVILGFTGTVLIEDLSENVPGTRPMLEDGRYRLTIDGAKLNIDANGADAGVDAVDDFFRFFGDSDGDEDVDLFDFARFRDYFSNGNLDFLFDFDDDANTPLLDFAQFRARFFQNLF